MKEAILTTARPVLALLLCVSLGACAGLLGEPPPEDRFFRLAVPPPSAAHARPPLPGTLEIARLGAEGLLAQRAIVYVQADQPHEVFDYNYHFWNQPPGELVQEQLIRYLRAANAADRVVSPELRLGADHVVEGRIRRFEQVFAAGVGMLLEIELGLIRSEGNELLLMKTYRAFEPAQGETIPAAVAATNAALAAIFAEFAADLRGIRTGS